MNRFINAACLLAISLGATTALAAFVVCVLFFVAWDVDLSLFNISAWDEAARGIFFFVFFAISVFFVVRSWVFSGLRQERDELLDLTIRLNKEIRMIRRDGA